MATVNEASVEKKLKNLTNTQESIQSLSLWAIHHKGLHEKLVEIWFKILKKSKLEHRLTLFYLCNEIVQTCKRKHAIMYKDAFKDYLKDASLLVRDATVRPNVERMFEIWKERKIYEGDFLDELKAVINNTKVRAALESKLVADFKPQECMDKVISLKRLEGDVELKRRQLVQLRMDASSIEAVKQLKDRTHGKEFCQEFEDACTKMEDYVECLAKEIKDRTSMIETLEQSELYYDAQYGEAKIVANAYKNFGTRVNNLRKRLAEHSKTLSSISPVPSPTLDAPSPGNTPPQPGDNVQTMDMEMSDDDDGHEPSTAGGKAEKPVSPSSDDIPGLEASPWKASNDDDGSGTPKGSPIRRSPGSNSIQSLAKESSFLNSNPSAWEQIPVDEGTPVEDGGATPTMDEPAQEKSSNPIDFLTQLINKNSSSSSGMADTFLENLTMLTKKVKTPKESSKADDTSRNWESSDNTPVWTSANDSRPMWQSSNEGGWSTWKAAQNEPPSSFSAPPPPPPANQQPLPPPPIPQQQQQQPPQSFNDGYRGYQQQQAPPPPPQHSYPSSQSFSDFQPAPPPPPPQNIQTVVQQQRVILPSEPQLPAPSQPITNPTVPVQNFPSPTSQPGNFAPLEQQQSWDSGSSGYGQQNTPPTPTPGSFPPSFSPTRPSAQQPPFNPSGQNIPPPPPPLSPRAAGFPSQHDDRLNSRPNLTTIPTMDNKTANSNNIHPPPIPPIGMGLNAEHRKPGPRPPISNIRPMGQMDVGKQLQRRPSIEGNEFRSAGPEQFRPRFNRPQGPPGPQRSPYPMARPQRPAFRPREPFNRPRFSPRPFYRF